MCLCLSVSFSLCVTLSHSLYPPPPLSHSFSPIFLLLMLLLYISSLNLSLFFLIAQLFSLYIVLNLPPFSAPSLCLSLCVCLSLLTSQLSHIRLEIIDLHSCSLKKKVRAYLPTPDISSCYFMGREETNGTSTCVSRSYCGQKFLDEH